jgi:hypothetical protein
MILFLNETPENREDYENIMFINLPGFEGGMDIVMFKIIIFINSYNMKKLYGVCGVGA